MSGLILCDTAPAADFGEAVMARAAARATPQQLEILTTALTRPFAGTPDDFGDTIAFILPLYFHEPDPARLDAVIREMRFSPGAFNRSSFECGPRFNTLDRLDEIDAPTLIMAGEHDFIMPPAHGSKRLHEAIDDSESVLFHASGHLPFVEEQDRFLKVVRDWLERVR